jgi:hypothetical protein
MGPSNQTSTDRSKVLKSIRLTHIPYLKDYMPFIELYLLKQSDFEFQTKLEFGLRMLVQIDQQHPGNLKIKSSLFLVSYMQARFPPFDSAEDFRPKPPLYRVILK